MTRFARALCVALALLAAGVPARAQAPTDDARAAMRELSRVMNIETLFDQMMIAMRPFLVDALARANPGDRGRLESAFDDLILPALIEEKASFIEAIEAIYLRHFSAAELRDVAAFYRTPTGAKTLRLLPVVQQESMIAGNAWGQTALRRALERRAEELRRRGINL